MSNQTEKFQQISKAIKIIATYSDMSINTITRKLTGVCINKKEATALNHILTQMENEKHGTTEPTSSG